MEGYDVGDGAQAFGCEHYQRKCAFLTPCCSKVYTCRLCHDEKETHEINRHSVQEVKCLKCQQVQTVAKNCSSCHVEFARYFCPVCRLYDDKDKKQFHCDGCGICRVGGRDNFHHCDRCGMCLAVELKDNHKCVEAASRSNCPVCMEDLHTSRDPVHIPRCGHLMHSSCYGDMLKSGNYACPLCGESLLDMSKQWKMIDEELEATPMPEEYRDLQVQVLCKDCHKESKTLFHVVGLKCHECGSYNTCRAAEPDEPNDTTLQEGDGIEGDGDRQSGIIAHPTEEVGANDYTPLRPTMRGLQPSDALNENNIDVSYTQTGVQPSDARE